MSDHPLTPIPLSPILDEAPAPVRRPRWRNYTAFVLSGGGARGAFQVGALRALLEAGERPDVVVGTSIGAWNGAWIARDPSLEAMSGLEDVWRSLDTLQVLLGAEPNQRTRRRTQAGMRLLMAARRVARGAPSLYTDAGLRQLLDRHQGETTFADLRLPLRIIAADLTTGTRAVFDSGRLSDAILASSAMPGVFPPICLNNHVYVDGGALDNCSLETALALGARRIVVVDVGYDSNEEPSPLWCTELTPQALRERGGATHAMAVVLQRMTQVVCRYQYVQALKRLPRGIELRFLCPGAGVPGSVLDFDRAGQWIEQGYLATRARLAREQPHDLPAASVS